MSFTSSYSAGLMRIYRWLWLGRVDSSTPLIPAGALVFAAHYNGAIDGMTYASQLPAILGVVSIQWHRTWLGRALLPGIAVVRSKDRGSSAGNLAAFRAMTDRVCAGERLLYFPEGTSQLGRERLPVGRGTGMLLRVLRTRGVFPPICFAAAHYHQPTQWRSGVSLGWVGPVALPPAGEDEEAWVARMLLAAQDLAYAQPAPSAGRWTWLAALLALPFLPVWALVDRLARRQADGENVIALWKFLFGVPLTFIALVVFEGLSLWWGVPACLAPLSLLGGALLWNR